MTGPSITSTIELDIRGPAPAGSTLDRHALAGLGELHPAVVVRVLVGNRAFVPADAARMIGWASRRCRVEIVATNERARNAWHGAVARAAQDGAA